MLKSCVTLSLLLIATASEAKLVAIELTDLVHQSTLIALGHTSRDKTAGEGAVDGLVSFSASRVLKGSVVQGATIHLCNEPSDSESFDLKKLSGDYIVFAAISGACYQPVHGISSVIRVKDGRAATLSIEREPDSQELEIFLSKIVGLTKAPSSLGK